MHNALKCIEMHLRGYVDRQIGAAAVESCRETTAAESQVNADSITQGCLSIVLLPLADVFR